MSAFVSNYNGFKILEIRPKVVFYSLISEYNGYKRRQKIINF